MNIVFASDYPEEDRYQERSLLKCLPGILKGEGKRLLYVGASSGRSYFLPDFRAGGYHVDILEAWDFNVKILREKWSEKKKGQGKVFHGDVRNCLRIVKPESYDVVFWWHGPEHIHAKDLARTLKQLEAVAPLVILGCPWGLAPQGPVGGNEYERHLASLEPSDFEKLGYKTDTVPGAGKDGRGPRSHITAWKMREERKNEKSRTNNSADSRRRERRARRAGRRAGRS